MPDIFSFRVELSMQCPRCDHPVPVDGPLTRATCPYCHSGMSIDRSYWKETLSDGISEMSSTPLGQGSGSTFFGNHNGSITLGRLDPYCNQCKTDFSDPWNLSPGEYECTECGRVWPVALPPEWLKEAVPGITLLINAMLDREGDFNPNRSAEPVALTCPSCSGNLSVDGTSRLVRCSYCDRQLYLPDHVWARMHGGRRKRRWFVVCNDS